MYQQKIGISLANQYTVPTVEVVDMVAATGFEAVSPCWHRTVCLDDVVQRAKDAGLILEFLHAPFSKAAQMWSEDKALAAEALAEHMRSLEDCHRYGIPKMVVHTWIGFDGKPTLTRSGLETYGKLVDKATEYGIGIAFENTEGLEALDALMNHFKGNDTVGFCWDSGHEMCYNYSKDLLALYGDRLMVTHLNDNLGIKAFDGTTFWHDDLHLLPYDGIADWRYNVDRLKKSKKLDILNFELNISSKPNRHENDPYGKLPPECYFAEAYKRACKIAAAYIK